ncbi:hypothetical protein [Marinagarivorans algicola]|uniref:hypothetical protein n=1 Tax=Marinagarivorans algicola TaxID=1513270 RepID=UPI0006B9AE25|nr:hypothetical protein [Marinagarivorans algicola]
MWITLLQELQRTYTQLQTQLNQCNTALQHSDWPFFDPAKPNDITPPNRVALVNTMLSISPHMPASDTINAGLLCATPANIALLEQLNHTKQAFKKAVGRIRAFETKDGKTRIDVLIDRVLKEEGRRGESLRAAFRDIGFSGVDLLRCYANIRILPKKLESISWTWAKKHASIIKITQPEALLLADELPSPRAKEVALYLLGQLPKQTPLVIQKQLPNQLRANIKWQEDKQIHRKAITVSGVVVSQDPSLPKITWRDNPGPPCASKPVRGDRRIDPTPYIKSLNIHCYLDEIPIHAAQT